MAFDGIVTAAVSQELSGLLTSGKIEKIYQPEPDEVILIISSNREKHRLFISTRASNPRIHLTPEHGGNPMTPYNFCMLLRKHIQGGRITSITQRDSERILELSVSTISELGFSQNKRLIVEIMGKHSNIILVDEETGKIIDSIKRLSIDVNRYRQTLPGVIYKYPPSQDKVSFFEISKDEAGAISQTVDPENDILLSKAILGGIQGISPAAARQLAKDALAIPNDSSRIYDVLNNMVTIIRERSFVPTVYLDDADVPVDFHILSLSELDDCKKLTFSSCSEMIGYYYEHKDSSNRIKQKSSDLLKAVQSHLDKLYLKKQRLLEDIQRAENADDDRIRGELLTANLHAISDRSNTAKVLDYYTGNEVIISLDPRLSPSQNAQRYYKKYNKAKTAIVEKNTQLEATDLDIAYLESVLAHIENATAIGDVDALRTELMDSGYMRRRKTIGKQQAIKPEPYAYRTKNGLDVLAGRNNNENDYLTLKKAGPKDIWFHTKDIPGSHVILFIGGKTPTEQDLHDAASIAAFHSKGRASENVPVDYTLVKYVKKPSGAKPGMVIFTHNKTLYVNPRLPS